MLFSELSNNVQLLLLLLSTLVKIFPVIRLLNIEINISKFSKIWKKNFGSLYWWWLMFFFVKWLMRDRKWPQFIKIKIFREINFKKCFFVKMISRKNKEETSEENKFWYTRVRDGSVYNPILVFHYWEPNREMVWM